MARRELGSLHHASWERGVAEARDAVDTGADPHSLNYAAGLQLTHLNGYRSELGYIIAERKEAEDGNQ